MRYVIETSGWGGYLPRDDNLKPWRSTHAVIVEAESSREALDQVMGKASRYPLLGSAWTVYELGPEIETWRTKAETPFTEITAYRVEA